MERLGEPIDPDLARTATLFPTEYYNKRNLQIITSNIYLFKVSNRNTRTSCEICSKLIKDTRAASRNIILLPLLLTWNIFQSFF